MAVVPSANRVAAKSTTPGRLVDVLRALPPSELDALVARLGVRIDPAKRLDGPAQIARALVALPELRDPFASSSGERGAAASRRRGARPPGGVGAAAGARAAARARAAVRARRGARRPGEARRFELIFPWAYLTQLRSWEGEDPRGMRALLAQAPFETTSAVAAHYVGRQATPPISLSLESAWEILGDEKKLEAEIEKLAPLERRLLESVEREGRRGRDRRAARARTRAAAAADRDRRDSVATRCRLLAREARAAGSGPPQPPRGPHRGRADHRRGGACGGGGAARRGAQLRRRRGSHPQPRQVRRRRGAAHRRSGDRRARAGQRGARGDRHSQVAGAQAVGSLRPRAGARGAHRRALARHRTCGTRRRPTRRRRRGRWSCASCRGCSSTPGAAAARGTRGGRRARCCAWGRTRATRARPAWCARWSSTRSATLATRAGSRGARSRATCRPTSASPG